ncbi:MAG: haloacid dehalogenase-like hydrolase [Verrucomicrobia bacterium]|nr:haloacid dehalogenase-like hydrolase [Verrucomicrobiota bacterium]
MLIGLDFDNTIICYDSVFHQVAVERALIPSSVPAIKEAIRNYLRSAGKEREWTELQGYVYGKRITEAEAFPGLFEFLGGCKDRNIDFIVISHKTQFPFQGPPYDLHVSARNWMEQKGFFDSSRIDFSEDRLFFEPTKQRKLNRIAAMGCQHFVDDLPEIFADPEFPVGVHGILFDPASRGTEVPGVQSVVSWTEVGGIVFSIGEVTL